MSVFVHLFLFFQGNFVKVFVLVLSICILVGQCISITFIVVNVQLEVPQTFVCQEERLIQLKRTFFFRSCESEKKEGFVFSVLFFKSFFSEFLFKNIFFPSKKSCFIGFFLLVLFQFLIASKNPWATSMKVTICHVICEDGNDLQNRVEMDGWGGGIYITELLSWVGFSGTQGHQYSGTYGPPPSPSLSFLLLKNARKGKIC